ncbi:MAG: GNAT family N-acetyltransferase [Lachnospiraceae bacterium]|nr:GNAT family N-acetyltransferase [Lachnospiraceae bacterium]
MNIRRAQEKDIPQLLELLKQVNLVHHIGRPDLFNIGTKYREEELKLLLQNEERPIFCWADEEDIVKGYAFCVFQQHVGDNILTDVKTLYIDDLCVDENARGRHIGRQLYDYVCSFAKEQGCYNVTLNVWSCNESAMKFYESCGLVPQKIGMEHIL